MKFYQTPLLAFVSTALVLSLTSAPAASASSVFVKRSNLSNRFIQPQAYVQPLDVRTSANSEEVLGLEGYAQEQLQKVPPPTKTEIVAGLTKNLKKGTKKSLQRLYDDLDTAAPVVADLRKDVDAITEIVDELVSAFNAINQDSSFSSQVISEKDTQALKEVLDKIQTYLNYIATTPKLNGLEKAHIFAGNGTRKITNVIDALVDQLKNVFSIVDTVVSGLLQDILTPLTGLINLITHL